MKSRSKRFVTVSLFFGSVLVFGTVGVSWLVSSRASEIEITLEWGRLAPFPTSAQQLTTTAHGSMFTREFRTSFVAPAADIENWLQSSRGAREAVITAPSPGLRHFQIAPGGGAEFAEVIVDDVRHKVSIRVYWS